MGTEKLDSVWLYFMTYKPDFLFFRQALRKFLTYVFIGVVTNIMGYAIYLGLTYFWDAPKLIMTALYLVGASIGFLVHRCFTFKHKGRIAVTGVRYLLAQLTGYLVNLGLLLLFVDWFDFPHQIVQALAIIVVGIFLFFVFRVFVFR